MNILIIGSGWLAQPLANHWQQQGHAVTLTTRSNEKLSALAARGLTVLPFELGESLHEVKPIDVCVFLTTNKQTAAHTASLDTIPASVPKLFISSTSVCANDGRPHTEFSTALNNSSPLLALESIFRARGNCSILRLAGLVGPDRHPGRFGQSGRPIKNPQAPVNLVHLVDAVGVIDAIVEQQAWGQLFHICANNHPTKQEYYSAMAAQLGLPEPEFEVSKGGSHKIIDCQWTLNHLGYELQYADVFTMPFKRLSHGIQNFKSAPGPWLG